MKIDKIISSNHHPFFIWLFVVFFIVGIFVRSSYLISIGFIFLFRYLVDINFLEKLHKEKPVIYMFLFVFGIMFIAVFLPEIIEKFV